MTLPIQWALNITNTALWWVDHTGHSKQCIWLKTRVRRSSVTALLWDDADEPSPVVCRTCGLEAKMESCLIHQPRWSVCRCELGMSNRYIETFMWNWNIWILIRNSIHQTGRRTRSSTLTISCSSNTEQYFTAIRFYLAVIRNVSLTSAHVTISHLM